ncbi:MULTISPECIES: hypothetical protein [unclassified Mucilaginibacter]|uniref:hypothetical protein n=1 Tax=unclassified Mucilaginibacter TaxID=2617802 RepID=UPI002AC9EB61|nr:MULTISPECIES: hypothetical protein [unclassified Mucilaginibacter]MEB0262304.1 hypothetical protein [Mucilaginibacter sp. 10I4]MEB0279951.1 hypothetical protein [Mucilaginibacter sp. 10B2]MEB0301807.1 hypothetical protein [Mucilaginibacter sp. 5C4]WPX21909.1 hypothetical protein RHM67_11495 [Mucilaginibacter sp. 5C4]
MIKIEVVRLLRILILLVMGMSLLLVLGRTWLKKKIANIGITKYSGFTSLNGSFSKDKVKKHLIFTPNVLKTVTIKPTPGQ